MVVVHGQGYDGNGNMVEYSSDQGELICTPRNVEYAHYAIIL